MLVASTDRRQFSSSPHTINSNSINYIEEPLYYTTPSTPTHAIYHPQYTLPASPAPLDIHHISKLMHLSNQGQNIWNGQLTPASSRSRPQQSHNRDSSLSSIGSVGPASPFNSTSSTSHPLIVLESDTGAYYDGLPATYQNYSKPLTPLHTSSQESFAYGYQSYPQYNQLAAFIAMQKQQDDDSMPAPEYSHSTRISVASQDSPSTPPIGEDYKTVPKLDRTMSDVYNDELYSPNFGYSSSTPTSKPVETTSPSHDIFSQRLQAANTQHLSATAQIPNLSRGRSPFRQGSPLAPTSDSFAGSQLRLGSAQQTRERRKAEGDAVAIAQQLNRASPVNITTPKTISPKDALLDYSESDEAAAMPLFPPLESTQRRRNVLVARDPSQSEMDETVSQQSFGSMATSRRESSDFSRSSQSTQQGSGFTFVPPAVPGVQIPQQYPFVPQPRREVSSMSSTTPDFPSTMTSQESSGSDYVPDLSTLRKPAGATADGGTYTCTYHGCSLRFETPAKLQKHKREGHRQSAPLSTTTAHSGQSNSPEATGMTSAALLRNSQAGPHKCERINPSTGKPCNTIFSRPYDLTRHEDTIHNARKQKVRCHLCTEEKTFSRNDALTRHMRVVHPEVDFPGKTKRRVHD